MNISIGIFFARDGKGVLGDSTLLEIRKYLGIRTEGVFLNFSNRIFLPKSRILLFPESIYESEPMFVEFVLKIFDTAIPRHSGIFDGWIRKDIHQNRRGSS